MSDTTPSVMSYVASLTTASASSSADPTVVPTSNGNSMTGTSFVGNTPSTVLFFLAMAVGVTIALLFIFFTARYFIRAKFGLHLYSASSRGVMFSPRATGTYNPVAYTDREIQEHLEYLRTHHFLRDDFLERRLYTSSSRRRRRRRRRGRFAKMKKLTPEEVENLFPKCRYADWINTGDGDSSVSVQVTNDDDSVMSASAKMAFRVPGHDPKSDFDVVEINEPTASGSSHPHSDAVSSGASSSPVKTELHFDSGSCSICLEIYESDDIVRGLICGHVYHAECVDPWLTRRRACCPICKRDYYKEENNTGSEDGSTNIEEVLANAAENRVPGIHDPERVSFREAVQDEDTPPPREAPETQEDGFTAENGATEVVTDLVSEDAPNVENTEENTSPPNQATNATTEEETRNPLRDLNYDVIRADANIQALFNELIPLSERVRVLLDEYPELDMDVRGKELAKKKYGTFFKVIFWRLMGISKNDLYNWAVIKIYQEEQASSASATDNDEHSGNEQQPAQELSRVSGESSRGATPPSGEEEYVEMREIRRPESAFVVNMSPATSVYHNAEEDLADTARRRESVEDRV